MVTRPFDAGHFFGFRVRYAGARARMVHRPRPSIEILTPAAISVLVKAVLVNWLGRC
jgi:hypothetical protein